MRRLFSLAVSRYLLRHSSLTRRLFSLALSRSFSSCSSVKFCLLSLILSCFLSRCSSVKLRLLSLALCRSRSRWAWFACRLLSRFLCLSLSLYSKLEVIINKICRLCTQNTRNWFCIGMLVVRTDGGRWTITWLPNFLGWVDLLTHGAPLARAARDGELGY